METFTHTFTHILNECYHLQQVFHQCFYSHVPTRGWCCFYTEEFMVQKSPSHPPRYSCRFSKGHKLRGKQMNLCCVFLEMFLLLLSWEKKWWRLRPGRAQKHWDRKRRNRFLAMTTTSTLDNNSSTTMQRDNKKVLYTRMMCVLVLNHIIMCPMAFGQRRR